MGSSGWTISYNISIHRLCCSFPHPLLANYKSVSMVKSNFRSQRIRMCVASNNYFFLVVFWRVNLGKWLLQCSLNPILKMEPYLLWYITGFYIRNSKIVLLIPQLFLCAGVVNRSNSTRSFFFSSTTFTCVIWISVHILLMKTVCIIRIV